MREAPSRVHQALRFVALAVVSTAVGVLVARFLFPMVLERNVLFLVLPILMVATLLLARAFRRGRLGS